MANLSGTWLGTYWQLGIPTRFEVTFVQSGNVLSGNILDDSYLGEAQVSGLVVGRNIRFTKSYLTTSPDPVRYTGTLSEDEDFMHGEWTIAGVDSGSWEARRSGDNLVADLQTRLTEQMPATVAPQ